MLIAGLGLVGCGSQNPAEPAGVAPSGSASVVVASVVPSASTTAGATAPPAQVDTPSGGAQGAPSPGSAEVSQQAYEAFVATWEYETLTVADLQHGREVTAQGNPTAYYHGWSSCQLLASAPPDPIANYLAANAGFTKTGSEAVVAAAMRTLCTNRNTGFLTWFDHNVAQAQATILRDTGAQTDESATGRAAKAVCAYLTEHGTAEGLTDHLNQQRSWPAGPDYTVPANLKHVVVDLVYAQCPALEGKLGPYWYS